MIYKQNSSASLLPIPLRGQIGSPIGFGAIHDAHGRRKYIDAHERARFLASVALLPLPVRSFCQLLVLSGCRISEALGVCTHHIGVGAVVFRTLKRRAVIYRIVQLPEWLTEQLLLLADPDEPAKQLWLADRSTAYRWVKHAMRMAHIVGVHACPKGLRHGYGVRNAGMNVPISLIKKWMGHSSERTTAIYLDAVGAEERAFAAKAW